MFDALAENLSLEKPKKFDALFLNDVLQGLSQTPKSISPKYFYDTQGSHFFDKICELEEYYPYRTELSLLPEVAHEVGQQFKDDVAIIEFGAGSLKKVQPLLNEMTGTSAFIPIDIAGDFLEMQCADLRQEYPELTVHPVVADFCAEVRIPKLHHNTKLGFFPGSTIGNFDPAQAIDFLQNAGRTLGANSHLLIGVDTKKSPSTLHNAYNDSEGVTASFNLNLLNRINQELEGEFDLETFEHYAFYNAPKGCIEMHLVSNQKQQVAVADQTIHFNKGESIHTESSYKYNPEEFCQLARSANWQVEKSWLSPNELFSMHLMRCE